MTWQANYVKMKMVTKLLYVRHRFNFETARKEQYKSLLHHEEQKYNHIRSLYADVVEKIHRVNPDSAFLPPEIRRFENIPYRFAVRDTIDMMTVSSLPRNDSIMMHYKLLEFLEMEFHKDPDISGQVHFMAVVSSQGDKKRVGYTYDQMAFHTIRRDMIEHMAQNIARMMQEELAKQY